MLGENALVIYASPDADPSQPHMAYAVHSVQPRQGEAEAALPSDASGVAQSAAAESVRGCGFLVAVTPYEGASAEQASGGTALSSLTPLSSLSADMPAAAAAAANAAHRAHADPVPTFVIAYARSAAVRDRWLQAVDATARRRQSTTSSRLSTQSVRVGDNGAGAAAAAAAATDAATRDPEEKKASSSEFADTDYSDLPVVRGSVSRPRNAVSLTHDTRLPIAQSPAGAGKGGNANAGASAGAGASASTGAGAAAAGADSSSGDKPNSDGAGDASLKAGGANVRAQQQQPAYVAPFAAQCGPVAHFGQLWRARKGLFADWSAEFCVLAGTRAAASSESVRGSVVCGLGGTNIYVYVFLSVSTRPFPFLHPQGVRCTATRPRMRRRRRRARRRRSTCAPSPASRFQPRHALAIDSRICDHASRTHVRAHVL